MDASLLDTDWIWHSGWIDHAKGSAGGFVHFRKRLNIGEVPLGPLRIQITADTRYKLYVNSQMVSAGPVKGDEHMWFYDEVDVQPFLRKGINRVSVRVLRFYYATPYATSFPRLPTPGLFVRTSDPQLRRCFGLQTDRTWEAALDDTTILRVDQKEDDFLHVYEDVKASRDAVGLTWVAATVLRLSKSHGLAPPWRLSPRLIPVSTSLPIRFKRISKLDSPLPLADWEGVLLPALDPPKILTLAAGSSHRIEIEADHHTTASLSFLFQRPLGSGSNLRVTYSECYEDEPDLVPYLRRKGDRTDNRKQLYGPQDQYHFVGAAGADIAHDLSYEPGARDLEIFSPFHFRTLRFIALDIDVAPDSDLVFVGVKMSETHYPLEVLGGFELPSADPHATPYNTIWDNSVRTLTNCMHDCYEDCPFYEQLQYAMDVRSSCLFTYAISGDDRLARQAIVQLHNSYRPALGLVASRSPAHQVQIIPNFSLFWICTVTDHFEHYADKTFTGRFLATCDSILESFAGRIDSKIGLVASSDKELGTAWDFVDWAPEWKPMGIPPQRTGFQTFTSMLYAVALQHMAATVRCIGRAAIAEDYTSRANLIISAIQRHCWNGTVFTDGLVDGADYSRDISEQVQIWAILCGATQGVEARNLLTRCLLQAQVKPLPEIETSSSITRASMAMSIYTLRAMSQIGGSFYDTHFHDFWNPWRAQIAQNMTTWCEDNVSVRSDCHAWSSVPLYEFMVEVAGVRPAVQGWDHILIKPRVKLFTQFDARVPLGGVLRPGVARVKWHKRGRTQITVDIENAPVSSVLMRLVLPDDSFHLHNGLNVVVHLD
ncbi:Six-hairpin glycosidase [Curvularia clavata]|uniref:Six-hairpin glycosidase n=1 Tax=Curvularia clavata TaxID=95742 RepID=A0A9Q8ZH16_CURCL|nr:Six-hairpin glycosidase [Curvularia clavata]